MTRPWAVLLDLDGTLLDTVPFILASVRHAFAGRPRGPSDADWVASIGTPLRVQLQPWTDGLDDLEAVVERYREHQIAHHASSTFPFPGAVDAIRLLHDRGHPIAVVTGKNTQGAARALRTVGLEPVVDALVAADTCAGHKPDPEPVLLALARVGREPGEALFVGDSPVDIAAGNAAGVVSVAATWGACSLEALLAARPARLLHRVEDLPALVDELAGVRRRAVP